MMVEDARREAGGQVAVALVEGWAEELRGLMPCISHHFTRAEAREHVLAYLTGLLSPVERKNSWQLAEAAGDATPYGIQHLLGRADWDADAVRDELRAYVSERLGDPRGVAIIDETGFLTHAVEIAKPGHES